LLQEETTTKAIRGYRIIRPGKLRVAEPKGDAWQVNEWVKAVVMYFLSKMETWEADFEYHDKMELKKDYAAKGIRVVPGASVTVLTFQAV
jgi:2,3,4,5-tetrahydropyridine-2-carboxylate N-succinyltransferase